jgi:predicted DNA-binding protein (MmcQ/YjbR family)
MTVESLRKFCASLPHVTEDVKWGNDLCFLIAGKMFCVASLDAKEGGRVAFKCSPQDFTDFIEREGIIPAPYMARNHWVSVQSWDALRDAEIRKAIQASYQLVFAKLPKRTQLGLQKRS